MNSQVHQKLETFFTQHTHHVYRRGELLIQANDNPSGIFYLKSGRVRMYLVTRQGNELILNIYKPVSFFPMSWVLNTTPNIYYYEALTDVEIYKAPRNEVLEFIKSNPDVLYDLVCRVYRGIDGINKRMSYLMTGSVQARLINELLIQAKRFGTRDSDDSVMIKISEKDIAMSAGTTRETVSREMKKLKEQNLVKIAKGVVTIVSMNLLEEQLMNWS